jgi:pyruvate,water dikinase
VNRLQQIFKPSNNEPVIRFRIRYETLRMLLYRNATVIRALADLEADLKHLHARDWRIMDSLVWILDEVFLLAQELNLLTNNKYKKLYDVVETLKQNIFNHLQDYDWEGKQVFSVSIFDERAQDPDLVGGKTSGLALLYQHFPQSVPEGFVLTTAAYRQFFDTANLIEPMRLLLRDLDAVTDAEQFRKKTVVFRSMIVDAELPSEIAELIKQHVRQMQTGENTLWAVRSSALSEDGHVSFAGQFETILSVKADDLGKTYQKVLASRFSDRVLRYCINCGIKDVEIPMAVIFMPMVDAQAAGVVYTTDPRDPDAEVMLVSTVPGLADKLVQGREMADTFYLTRQARPALVEKIPVDALNDQIVSPSYLHEDTLMQIGAMAYQAKEVSGSDLDIEWAVDHTGKVWFLQCRRLTVMGRKKRKSLFQGRDVPLCEGGIAISPGRAEGRVVYLSGPIPQTIPHASVLAVQVPSPDLAPLLPDCAAFLASEGSAVGHLATLLREFSIPSIFRLRNHMSYLQDVPVISVDATNRKIYAGSRWPDMKQRVLTRLKKTAHIGTASPVFNLVIALNLTDPFSPKFNIQHCQSVHDIIRFTHEMAVRAMFDFGDSYSKRFKKRARKLISNIPVRMFVMDLANEWPEDSKSIHSDEIQSSPFKAFWEGLNDPRLFWPERWDKVYSGLPSDFREMVSGGSKEARRPHDANYIMVAQDYLNFNARFAYHYTMVDALVNSGVENNYVHLRFNGGGAGMASRTLRAQFVEQVLRESGFSVDRREDTVIAWFRRYPETDSLNALALLGRLLVCARQLDVVLKNDEKVKMYARSFLTGNYDMFAH